MAIHGRIRNIQAEFPKDFYAEKLILLRMVGNSGPPMTGRRSPNTIHLSRRFPKQPAPPSPIPLNQSDGF
jgi:hypothetical protein